MKRYLSLFLAAAVLISCLTITAFADDGIDSPSSFQSSFADMLIAENFSFYQNDVLYQNRQKPSITFSSGAPSCKVSWTPLNAVRLVGYNFCLWSTVKPDSVIVSPFPGGNQKATYVSSDGYFHYYTYSTSVAFDYNTFSVTANYSGTLSRNFGLINFYGYLPDSFTIDSAKFYHDIEYVDSFWQIKSIVSGVTSTFPKSFDYGWQINYFSFFTVIFTLPANVSSLSFNFTSLGSIVLDSGVTVGVYKGNDLQLQVPVEIVEGLGSGTGLPNGNALLYSYTCNADLSGVDLTGCQIKVKVEIDSFENDGIHLSKINFLDFAYKQNVYSIPWYLQFYNWITAKMTAGYQSIVDAIKGDSNTEMNEATDQMEGAANDFKESSDAFEQVETPDIDAGALTGDLTNFSVSGLAVLGVITANPYVTSLLVLVFTFALCAYIFFGKKR